MSKQNDTKQKKKRFQQPIKLIEVLDEESKKTLDKIKSNLQRKQHESTRS